MRARNDDRSNLKAALLQLALLLVLLHASVEVGKSEVEELVAL